MSWFTTYGRYPVLAKVSDPPVLLHDFIAGSPWPCPHFASCHRLDFSRPALTILSLP